LTDAAEPEMTLHEAYSTILYGALTLVEDFVRKNHSSLEDASVREFDQVLDDLFQVLSQRHKQRVERDGQRGTIAPALDVCH
jgi:hypothetical protein